MIKNTGNIYYRNHLFAFFIFFLPFIFQIGIRAETFWIIENPSALIISNHYEQRLTLSEKAAFQTSSAWQILSEDHMLSDQFTKSVKVVHKQKIFYFQQSESGEIINQQEAGSIQIIKNTDILGDTIRIKQADHLFLNTSKEQIALTEGTLLIRLFKYKNRFFVENLNNNPDGWILLRNSEGWEKYHLDTVEVAYEDQLFVQINGIFDDYNHRLSKLFKYLNTKYETHHPLPHWSGDKSPSMISYKIEPNSYRNRFSTTKSYLIQELRDLLHGSQFQVAEDKNQIIIHKKSN